jgi:site-specific recombinase XerD
MSTLVRLKPKTIHIPGNELEYIGPYGMVTVRQMPLIRLDKWHEDLRIVGPNGRRRNKITIPGTNKGVKPPNTGKTYPPEPLTNAEALHLLSIVPQHTMTGVRNRALLALLWRTGLRVSEALDLKPHHVDFIAKRVTVLHGKGDKRRTVGIDDYGLCAVQPWLLERAMLGIPNDKPLFCTTQLPGRGNRLYSAQVRVALHRYGAAAGIPKRVHPHGFRHTLACDLVMEGFSIVHVQSQLGHNNVATTAGYLRGLGADEAFDRVAARVAPGGAR